jgi:hypothetical protein
MQGESELDAALRRTRLDLAIHLLRDGGGFQSTRSALLRKNNTAITTILTQPAYRELLSFGDINEASKVILAALNRTLTRAKGHIESLRRTVCRPYCHFRHHPVAQLAMAICKALELAGVPDASELAAYLVHSEPLLASMCPCD